MNSKDTSYYNQLKVATPKWADREAIRAIYKKSKNLGPLFQVDHIVPIQSKYVCGLHVDNNLRIIEDYLNILKSNNYWEDMWHEQLKFELIEEPYQYGISV